MSKTQKNLTIFTIAVGFRIAIYLISALIMAFQITDGTLTLDIFLSNWCKWDANHYINIATNGYQGAVEFCEACREAALARGISAHRMPDGQHLFLVFFPLFPFTLRILHFFIADIRIAGMVLSTLAYAGGCLYMYHLVKLDYSETVAENSVVLLSLFPFSFFFGGILSEGLFFLVSAATLYYIRKHRWWIAILFGILATMCRMQGALLFIPAALELLCVYRPHEMIRNKDFRKCKEMIGRGASLFLMFMGTGIYLLINWYVEGYPFSFMIYQNSHWHQGATLPTTTLSYVFTNAFGSSYPLQTRMALWIPQAVLAIASVIILLYGIKKLRAFHMGYGTSYVLLTYSAKWLLSGGRYLSCCIPLFIILGIATEKRKGLMSALVIVFTVLQTMYFIGFFNNLQIM